MLWSLLKILIFVALVAALALGAGYLMESGGPDLRIAFGPVEFTLGPLQAVIAALVLVVLVWLVLKLAGLVVAALKFLNGDETALTRYFHRNRERRGYDALAQGMLALASGEGRLAMSKAAKAERFLQRPELTNLISAQAAEMTGDRKKAEEIYKRLLNDDRTRFVGVRGLLKQKLEDGDTDTALRLAEKAFDLKPRHTEIHDTLLRLQAEKEDWAGARATLGAKLKNGSLPRDVYNRRDAVLALSKARNAVVVGNSDQAREGAIEANRLSPSLVPAAVMAARAYLDQGKPRQATRILKKAWSANPHPDLAAAFADIVPDETPSQRLKRFRALIRLTPDDPEARMLLAELEIANKDFPAARKALGDLVEDAPTARVLTLMAAIERGEGSDDAVVRAWLTKALSAPRGPQWICDNCQAVHANWAPVCDNCGSFDTLSWRTPLGDEASMPAATGMLPLIVGTPQTSTAAAGGMPETPSETPSETLPETTPEAPTETPAAAPQGIPSGSPDETPEPTPAEDEPPKVVEGEVVALGGGRET